MPNMTIESATVTETVENPAQRLEEILSELRHDLRSPLAAVNLNIETALRRVPAQGKVADALTPPLIRARDIVKQTVLLMDELLTEARDRNLRYGTPAAESPPRAPAPSPRNVAETRDAGDPRAVFDLGGVIHDCVALHSALLHAARCAVTVRCEGTVAGSWPRGTLFQILSNLLVNATKYAPGQPIQVHATRVGRTVVLGVADCGPGFSEEEQARIFDRFRQEPRQGGRNGHGLGLWIVRRAVERLGGTLRLITAPGEGALFLIELPSSSP